MSKQEKLIKYKDSLKKVLENTNYKRIHQSANKITKLRNTKFNGNEKIQSHQYLSGLWYYYNNPNGRGSIFSDYWLYGIKFNNNIFTDMKKKKRIKF